MEDASKFLADRLRQLSRLPLNNADDVVVWDRQAAAVQSELERCFPGFEVPHAIQHYFIDSDIRARDAGYKQRQERFVADYIFKVHHEKVT